MKEYSTFPKAPELELHYQMVQCHIQDTSQGGLLISLKRFSQCIQQSQLIGFVERLVKEKSEDSEKGVRFLKKNEACLFWKFILEVLFLNQKKNDVIFHG